LQLAAVSQFGVSLLSVVTAAAWFTYFRMKERHAKPLSMMVLAIVGGYLSAFGALFIYNRLDSLGYATDWRVLQESWRRGLPMSLMIGWVEETAKAVPVLLLVAMSRRITRSRDGIYLSACAGLGFAVAENAILAQQAASWAEGLARAATTPVTHALFAAPWGYGLANWLLHRRPRVLVLSFVTSIFAHAMYDFLLARPHVPVAASAGVVAALWAWLILRTQPLMAQASARASRSLTGATL
jgi:RsiW-degrading membrane proteinase PrsW (M82 family)